MRDRERRRGAHQRRDRRDRHLRAGLPARRGTRHIELGEDRGIALIHRQRLQHDAVLVGLAVDGRDLPLRERVVQRVGDALQADAELARARAVDIELRAQAAFLRFRGDVAEQRIAPHLARPAFWPIPTPAPHRCRSACTGIASGSTASRSARPAPAGNRSSCRGSPPTFSFSRAMTTATSSRRSPRGFSVITSRPTLVVGLTEPAPITETTPVTSGSALIASAASVCRVLHLGKGDVGAGLRHRRDRGRVLQRQKALGRHDIEHQRRDERRQRHDQRRALVLAAPTAACGGRTRPCGRSSG